MQLADITSFRTIEELTAHQADVRGRISELDTEFAGQPFTAEAQTEWAGLRERDTAVSGLLTELVARRDYVAAMAGKPGHIETGIAPAMPNVNRSRLPEDIYNLASYRQAARSDEDYSQLLEDGARKAIDLVSFAHERAEADKNRAHLTRLLASQDGDDHDKLARHLLEKGSPRYARAFGKHISGRALNPDEMRALSTGTGSDGGFAVPVALDPTLILTSDGVINPLRSMARVETIVSNTWRPVTSGRVTASYGSEGSATSAQSPVLDSPEVKPLRASTLIDLTIEIDQDWGRAQAEMARLIQDAKDELEAEKFAHGLGTTEPEGIIATMPSSSKVGSASNTFDESGIYAVKNATPARFRARGQYLAESSIYDEVRQLDNSGGSALWVQLTDGRPAQLVGYPAQELSTMDSAVEDGAEILVFGDYSQFVIVERVGLSVEVIPHLFDGDGKPTGQRGLFAYWRNNSQILVPNAFRLLVVGPVGSGS
jgi:HK97 family phage major capsid protein